MQVAVAAHHRKELVPVARRRWVSSRDGSDGSSPMTIARRLGWRGTKALIWPLVCRQTHRGAELVATPVVGLPTQFAGLGDHALDERRGDLTMVAGHIGDARTAGGATPVRAISAVFPMASSALMTPILGLRTERTGNSTFTPRHAATWRVPQAPHHCAHFLMLPTGSRINRV